MTLVKLYEDYKAGRLTYAEFLAKQTPPPEPVKIETVKPAVAKAKKPKQ